MICSVHCGPDDFTRKFSFKDQSLPKTVKLQKRALQVIVPALSYREALQFLNLPRLDERNSELCVNTFKKISKGGGEGGTF